MLIAVVNCARTPPFARDDDAVPTAPSPSRTRTRPIPARFSSRAQDRPITPPPTIATSQTSRVTATCAPQGGLLAGSRKGGSKHPWDGTIDLYHAAMDGGAPIRS